MTIDQIKQEAIAAKAQGNVVVMSAVKLLEMCERIEALVHENGQCRDKWMQVCLKVSQLERENAELRKQLAAVPITEFPQSFRDDLSEAIRLGKVTIS